MVQWFKIDGQAVFQYSWKEWVGIPSVQKVRVILAVSSILI